MICVRGLQRGVTGVTVLLVLGCGIVEPCDLGVDENMDGTWRLTLINGQPIPAQGVVVSGTTHRLKEGELFFKTYTYTRCDDDVGRVTSGSLVAQYFYVDVVGQPAGYTYRGAKFIYDNGTGALTISAGDRAVNGDRLHPTEFTIQQTFGDITYALTFNRISGSIQASRASSHMSRTISSPGLDVSPQR